jgi:uncharacterized spore protein YtfJ
MVEEIQSQVSSEPTDSTKAAETTMKKFLDAGSVRAVYGEPASYGDITIIPAAEVVSVMGFGLGSGSGGAGQGGGSGGGGGGGIQSRPVAAVVITPNGVRIEPIVDVTKVWLAGLTAAGFIFGMLARMRRRWNKVTRDR